MSDLVIGGRPIAPGERVNLQIPVARLKTQTEVAMPVRVVRGRRPGPTLFVCGALHGDEINGVEIVRRLLRLQMLRRLRGTLIAVPVVNVFGFISLSRYLPDRRDLNRSFPGSEGGSLAARLADIFMSEIVERSTHGIDLHTGALHRTNLPQMRVGFEDVEALRLAKAFGTPVVIDSSLRDGSLREAVQERGIPVVIYEGGEALRFDEWAIRPGLRGIVSVMQEIGMLPAPRRPRRRIEPLLVSRTTWLRATESGILTTHKALGSHVHRGDVLGTVGDPFGDLQIPLTSPADGVIVGHTNLPLLNEGDAVFHIARIDDGAPLTETLEAFQDTLDAPFVLE